MKINEMSGFVPIAPLQSNPVQLSPKTGAAFNPAVGNASAQGLGKTFSDVFSEQLEAGRMLQFSKHAAHRLNSRQIALSDEQLERVEHGVASAYAKGIRDSLVLVDEVALVVNINSRTVITAMERDNDSNIFTNIDGAVIV